MQKMMYQIDKYASFYRMCIKVLWKEFVSHGMHIQEYARNTHGKHQMANFWVFPIFIGEYRYPFIVGISNEET